MADTPKNDYRRGATDSAPENSDIGDEPSFTNRISGLTAQWDEETNVGTAPEDKLAEFAKRWQEQGANEAADDAHISMVVKQYDEAEAEELPPMPNAEEYVRPHRSLFGWGIAQWASVLMVILALVAFGIGLYLLPGHESDQPQPVAVAPTSIPAPTATIIVIVTAAPSLAPTSAPDVPTAAPIVPTQAPATQALATATAAPTSSPAATATYDPVIATLVAENPNNAATPAATANTTATAQLGDTTYKVQEGDTLGKIALKFKVDPDILAGYNKLTNADVLRIDQTLRIPPPNFTPVITTKKP